MNDEWQGMPGTRRRGRLRDAVRPALVGGAVAAVLGFVAWINPFWLLVVPGGRVSGVLAIGGLFALPAGFLGAATGISGARTRGATRAAIIGAAEYVLVVFLFTFPNAVAIGPPVKSDPRFWLRVLLMLPMGGLTGALAAGCAHVACRASPIDPGRRVVRYSLAELIAGCVLVSLYFSCLASIVRLLQPEAGNGSLP